MDELFRLTPEERRRRRIIRLAAAGFVVAVVFAGVAVSFFMRVWNKEPELVMPAAYLVSTGGATTVRVDGKNIPFETTLAVPSGSAIDVPARANIIVVHPGDASSKKIKGPETLRPEPAREPKKDAVDFLVSPREILITARYGGPRESTGRVLVTSPFGVTRFTNPTITWEPRPGVRYDVAVVDPADPVAPPRVAINVLPPLRIDQLETTQDRVLRADRIYNVIVREAGSETQVGAMRFLVSPGATDASLPLAPADLVMEAIDALWSKPARMGDGWLALSRLPADWAESELVLRLRMRAAAELGLFDEIEKIQYQLWMLGPMR
ncbi:hypothetical protein M2103_001620 [Ereboglobus sp. PH5-5]|uniref:hypothetical protein n=1 Tax=Ereboglobus sp. PH5-5 TaxID=2940529 RepID=UPI002404DD30|nr:hypothetical protein [Ereboglobus sp. PH5-5]MDF9833396.1 hypothetical protein [Ereboglobus sp. PH5-5]